MNILYDYQIFQYQKYGGISRYFYELISWLSQQNEIKIPIVFSNNHYIKGNVLFSYLSIFQNFDFKGKQKLMEIPNRFLSNSNLKKQNFDIFHPTYYNPYFLEYLGKKPFVLTIYDMIHEKFNDMFSYKDKTSIYKKVLAQRATKIIAISNNTKQDIVNIFGIEEKKIDVVYLANSIPTVSSSTYDLKLPQKYILFIGNRNGYKNFKTFVEAARRLLNFNKEINIVCIGGGEFNTKEKLFLEQMGIIRQIFQYDLSDKALANIYKKAIMFIFPSLYEGFGIPILEAFANECPVVCSSTGSFPEIAQNAALYFDPNSVESIENSIYTLIDNNNLKKELVQNGRKRLANFSWEKTAAYTEKIYKEIL